MVLYRQSIGKEENMASIKIVSDVFQEYERLDETQNSFIIGVPFPKKRTEKRAKNRKK